jgi:divalent anion:Na+ symporter, DASS family
MADEPKALPPSTAHKLIRLGACAGLALIIGFSGPPDGVTPEGWHVAAVFIATILSFVLKPMAMGPMVLLALTSLGILETLRYTINDVAKADQSLTFKRLLSGYGDSTVWLVVAAFLLAGAMIRTGLGQRIALTLIKKLGKSMLGLGYASVLSELVLGPFIPSNTARGGGLMAPIMDSLSRALKSRPEDQPNRAGSYLMLVGSHANLITAAMFLTGMAANPLFKKAAESILNIEFGWGTWALGSIVPGLVSLGLLPLLIMKLAKPELTDTSDAQASAGEELEKLGPWSYGQKVLLGVLALLLCLWTTKSLHHLGTGLVAWIGVLILVFTNTFSWNDIIKNHSAWDALVWLGGLVTMANVLREEKVIGWFADLVKTNVSSLSGVGGVGIVLILGLIYFYSMYGFSMLTGHILALGGAFLAIALSFGAPPYLTAAIFAYFSCLCACTTNYSTGPVIIYFGLGYVSSGKWFQVGLLVSIFHITVWLSVGLGWWKILGWW